MESRAEEGRRVDTCEALVVGAGIVGAAVAAHLADRGVEVAVLDAQEVAGGATGRSAGMVTAGLPGHYHWAAEAFGRTRAQALWALTLKGRSQLVDAAIRLGVPLEQPGSLTLAVTDEEKEVLLDSATMLAEDGFDAEFQATDPPGRGFKAAFLQPKDAVVDVVALTQSLLATTPIAVHINTEVHRLEQEGEMIRVEAQRRTVRCRMVVLAVDGHAPLLAPSLAQWISPGRALLVNTDPLPEQPLSIPYRVDYGYEYARPLPDNRLLLGAWRRSDAAEEQFPRPEMALREGLARFIDRHFPEAVSHITQRQLGVVGLTPDGLPVLGHLPDLPQVAFAVGFGAWGLNLAFVAARKLVDWMVGEGDLGLLSVERFGSL